MTDHLEATLATLVDRLATSLAQRLNETSSQPADPGETSTWMSIDKAAAYLDWPKQRLYKLSAAGAIPHYKHDGRLLFNRQELDHWLRQHAQGLTG
jgi:excisionase family DNA binding protein